MAKDPDEWNSPFLQPPDDRKRETIVEFRVDNGKINGEIAINDDGNCGQVCHRSNGFSATLGYKCNEVRRDGLVVPDDQDAAQEDVEWAVNENGINAVLELL